MRVCVFIDLDDTLFQTLPKCPPGADLRPAAISRDGVPLCFMTDRQARFFEWLDAVDTVIPVTARNHDAFRRVKLDFRSLAILDFGGAILLPDGRLDPEWDDTVRPRANALASTFRDMHARLTEYIGRHSLGVNARVIVDFDMPLYLVMKHPADDITALDRIRLDLLPGFELEEFFVHANGNNLSIAPRFLGKERAVAHVLDRHLGDAPCLTIGVGDSLSDIPFMSHCDFLMTPVGSQLARELRRRDG